MSDQDHIKDQFEVCERLHSKDMKRIYEKFKSTDDALKINQKELERRMHESNDIKKDFTEKMVNLQIQVGSLETKSALWMKMVGFGLAILQVIIGLAIRFSIR